MNSGLIAFTKTNVLSLLLACLPLSANALATASVNLSNFYISLTSLDPSGLSVPSITLEPKTDTFHYASTGAYVELQGSLYNVVNYYYMDLSDSKVAAVYSPEPNTFASSSIMGDTTILAGNHRSATATVAASGSAGNYSGISAYLFASKFTLSPMTKLEISTDVNLTASYVTAAEHAVSLAIMYLTDTSQVLDTRRYQMNANYGGNPDNAPYSGTFSIEFQNTGANSFAGEIAIGIRADAYISAVPEPSAIYMLLLGLPLLARRARQTV